jgi:hypothetical protein
LNAAKALGHIQPTHGRLATLARLAYVNFTNIHGNHALDTLMKDRCDMFQASEHPELHTPANVIATKR